MICGDNSIKIEILKGFNGNDFYSHPRLIEIIDPQKLGIRNLFLSVENNSDENTYTPKNTTEGINVFKKDYQTNSFKLPKSSSLIIYQENFNPIIIYVGYNFSEDKHHIIVLLKVSDLQKIKNVDPYYEIYIIGKNINHLIKQISEIGFDKEQIIHNNVNISDEGILITNKRRIQY